MKLLFDQNLSHHLARQLCAEFPDSVHVRDVGLEMSSDSVIWSYAATKQYTIVSKDFDFQQRALLFGHPPKVIWIRTGNQNTSAIAELLRTRGIEIESFISNPKSSFLALS